MDGSTCLTLYGRADCHLCEDMQALLEGLRDQWHFSIKFVDIDTDASLAARYGHRIPVLAAGERELCELELDQVALRNYFAGNYFGGA